MAGQGRRVQRCSAAEGEQGQSRPLPPEEEAAGQPSQPRNQRSLAVHSQEGEEARQWGLGPGPELAGIFIYSPSSGEHPRAVQGWAEEE